MKHFSSLSFLPRFGGRRASFKIGVVATLAIAVAANVAVLGNLGVLFGHVVPGATHQHLYEPYFQALDYKAMPASQMGIFRPVYDRLVASLKGRGETALYQTRGATLSGDGHGTPSRFVYLGVTPSLAQVLGVHAVAGRMLDAADSKQGAEPVMVISARFARARFTDAKSALNRSLTFKGKNYRIVGVLPAALSFPSGHDVAAWVPLPPEPPGKGGDINFGMHALVHPGSDLSTLTMRAALDSAYRQSLPDYNPGMRTFIESMHLVPRVATLAQREYGSVLTQLQLLELAALLLLLLVLANLAGLATSDALARRHELATRVALGAGAFRLFGERTRELGLLGVIGWTIGVGLGWLGSRALALVIGQAGPSVTLSVPVLLLTLAAVLVITTLLAAGGIRRLHSPNAVCADLMSGGHTTGGRGLARALRAFIVLQLALSVVLLVIAGHLRVNVFGLTHGDFGFTPAQRTFFSVELPSGEGNQTEVQYKAYVARERPFIRSVLDRLNGLPGIESAALLKVMPFSNGSDTTNARISPSDKKHSEIINTQTVSRQIVPTLGLRVLAGNLNNVFSGNGNAIFLDAAAVKLFWPDSKAADVVGRSLYVGGKARRVVAVVEPLRMKPYGSIGGTMFVPFDTPLGATMSGGPPTFMVHSTLPHKLLREEVTTLVQKLAPQVKHIDFKPAGKMVAQAYAARDHLARVFGVLALAAVLIAAVGLFALLAYRTRLRRQEFAIRAALGATSARLRLSVIKEALALWLVGVVIGIPAAYELARILAAGQPELGLPTTATVILVIVAMFVIVGAAAFIPARHAGHTNPVSNMNAHA